MHVRALALSNAFAEMIEGTRISIRRSLPLTSMIKLGRPGLSDWLLKFEVVVFELTLSSLMETRVRKLDTETPGGSADALSRYACHPLMHIL